MPKTTKRIPSRKEVRETDTWDLRPLFKSDAAWERGLKEFAALIPRFEAFRGRLGTAPKVLRDCCRLEVEVDRLGERLQNYAFLKSCENVADGTYQGMLSRYVHAATHAQEASSFIAPEIRAIPRAAMARILRSPLLAEFRFGLEKLLRYRPHILSVKEERLLAMQGEVADASYRAFEQLCDADLKFGFVKDERGVKVELTQSTFRALLDSPRRSVRRQAFERFYAQYEAHANTLASTLSAAVLQDVYMARARNFGSCLEQALFGDRVPIAVYDSLIAAVRGNLDTAHRYLDVRRRALRLRKLAFYDTYVPIVPTARRKTPYAAAARLICDALRPLGADYCRALEKGLLEARWVDRYENQGKRSGAFSSGGYDGPPYILMNYQDSVPDGVFTLAHEAGHSMHTRLSAGCQPFQYYHYPILLAEVASTFNEQLLNAHLLAQARDKRTRAYLINREIDEIRGTIVRQTMFAEFEKTIHALAEEGEPLTLDRLRAEYRALLEAYFGPDVEIDDALSLECLRIPHFYSAFYVYKYATGLSAAIALSRGVLEEGASARDRYLEFLSAGGSGYPLDLLRAAGVDLEDSAPVATAMARFRELVDELETLV